MGTWAEEKTKTKERKRSIPRKKTEKMIRNERI